MEDIADYTGLSFFTVSRYSYTRREVCDFRTSPRPHYCMGYLLEGRGTFHAGETSVEITPGDIIFVPVSSRYLSEWQGDPSITYISMHFFFLSRSPFVAGRQLPIQKISPSRPGEFREEFLSAYRAFQTETPEQFYALSAFYRIMGGILPRLVYGDERRRDIRVEPAAAWLDTHFREPVEVEALAALCGLSSSHFHTCFKAAYGQTPISYKHRVCIRYAILELLRGEKSIEEISTALGFASSAYFRRVFRQVTGCPPSAYVGTNRGM